MKRTPLLLFMLLLFSCFGQLAAQKNVQGSTPDPSITGFHFCGDQVQHPPVNPQQASAQDRWNNPITISQNANRRPSGHHHGGAHARSAPGITVGPAALVPIDCANGFHLTFEDIESGTGTGFDDGTLSPCGTGMTLGQERVSTACAVFDYIASVIDMGSATVDIYFPLSEFDGTGALASASPIFATGLAPGTYTSGHLRDHIVNGVDPDPTVYDAIITFDFGTRFISGTPFEIFPCTSCPDGELDMYSIMLHEVTHALGFLSLINSDGTSKYSGLTTGPFSMLDDHMLNGAASGLLSGGGAFSGPLADISNDVITYFKAGNTQAEPVYSPTTWASGSSLSHFDNDRSTFRFVMHPSTPGGDNRLYSMPEIEVLADLGYTLKSDVYTGPASPNRYVIGNDDDGYTTTPGSMICIPALVNDVDPDLDPISYGDCGSGCTVSPADVTLVLGSGTVSVVGANVCFTPEPWYGGPVLIKYCPTDGKYDPALVNTDNCTYIRIDVDGPCPGDPCNLVCNGDFENRSDNCTVSFGFSSFIVCPSPRIVNVCKTSGSPDIMVRGCPGMSFPAGGFDIPNNIWAGDAPNPGTQTWDWPAPGNNTYLGMWQNLIMPYTEGMYMELVAPLEVGESYKVSFWASSKTQASGIGIVPGRMLVGFKSAEPTVGDFDTNISLDWYAPTNSPFVSDVAIPSTAKTAAGEWNYFSFTVTPTIPNLRYLIMEPSLFFPGEYKNYLFLDDVRVERAEPQIQIIKTVSNPNPEPGETITYNIIISNMDPSSPATDVEIQDLLPPGLTYVSSTLSSPPSDHTIPLLGPMTSNMVTITATVDMDAPLGVPITNCAYVTSGNNCLNYDADNCVDIIIPATDVSVNKEVVSGPGPYLPGDMVTYEITVDNLGPFDASFVWVADVLPSELTYVSHSIVGPGSFVNPSLGIPSLPVGGQTVLTLNAMIDSTAGCGTVTNCATMVFLGLPDLVISNNSDCADIEVAGSGGAPDSWPVHPTGTGTENAQGIYKPASGLVVTGNFSSSIDFGEGPLTSAGDHDAYVIKYGDCDIEWQHRAGGTAEDRGIAVAAHPVNARLYACGNAGSAFNYQGVNLPGSGTYVVELNPADGMAIWGRVIPNASVEDIAVCPSTGNVAVVGEFSGSFDFGGSTYTSAGGMDMYVAVYSQDGTELWADAYGSVNKDIAKGLDFRNSGHLYIGGSLGGLPTAAFGLTAPAFAGGGSDGFVGRYAPSGSRVRGSYFASTGPDIVNDIDMGEVDGQLYVAGNNGGTMTIGGGPVIASFGGQDAFVANLTANFTGLWAHHFGSLAPNDYAASIDQIGTRVYVGGGFRGVAIFPGFPNPTLTGLGAIDIFMATFNSTSGAPIHNIQSNNTNHWSYCADLTADDEGNGYLAGDFFAETSLGGTTLTSLDGAPDAFVARGSGLPGGMFYKGVDAELETTSESLRVFPNPTRGRLTIRQESASAASIKLTLIDLHGKTEVLETAAMFSAGELTLDLSAKAQGIYFLQMERNGQLQTEKIVLMEH